MSWVGFTILGLDGTGRFTGNPSPSRPYHIRSARPQAPGIFFDTRELHSTRDTSTHNTHLRSAAATVSGTRATAAAAPHTCTTLPQLPPSLPATRTCRDCSLHTHEAVLPLRIGSVRAQGALARMTTWPLSQAFVRSAWDGDMIDHFNNARDKSRGRIRSRQRGEAHHPLLHALSVSV